MASITIRHLDDEIKAKLRVRAAKRGRSMEDEARNILQITLAGSDHPPSDLGKSIHQRFADLKGPEIDLPTRESIPQPPKEL